MDLEQRVQALEQELEILKNQVQATLLDIQEQLLTNAYPSLRAEDTKRPPTRQVVAAAHAEIVRDITEDEQPMPTVRKVSFQEISPAQLHDDPDQNSLSANDTSAVINWNALDKMELWATQKVKEMGAKRTRKLIDMYAEQGRFSASQKDMLLQLVTLYEEDHRPSNSRTSSATATIDETQPAPKSKGQKTAASRTAKSAPVVPEAPPANAAAQRQPTPSEPAQQNSSEDAPSALVLKLIAGIQNAGAGVQWKKNHG